MPRRRFRYDPALGKLVEIMVDPDSVFGTHAVIGEIEPFVSPVDGTVISSRTQLRQYMAEKGLVNFHDAQGATPEKDRYQAERERREMRERLWEGVNRTFSMGNKPRDHKRYR